MDDAAKVAVGAPLGKACVADDAKIAVGGQPRMGTTCEDLDNRWLFGEPGAKADAECDYSTILELQADGIGSCARLLRRCHFSGDRVVLAELGNLLLAAAVTDVTYAIEA